MQQGRGEPVNRGVIGGVTSGVIVGVNGGATAVQSYRIILIVAAGSNSCSKEEKSL